MSKRTSASHKAIRIAWERERELVSNGQGTRDWTPEQQKTILDPDRGKAYDENEVPFQGQHMKSVQEYPEHEGNPDNIQFLSRKEHLEAHKGNWQNPTNWYYDPVEKQFFDFGDSAPIPCKIIELSNPIIRVENRNTDTVVDEFKQTEKKHTSGTDPPNPNLSQSSSSNTSIRNAVISPEIKHTQKGNRFNSFFTGAKNAVKHLWKNYRSEIISAAIVALPVALEAIASFSKSGDSSNTSRDIDTQPSSPFNGNDFYQSVEDTFPDPPIITNNAVDDDPSAEKRKSPIPHNVNAKGQHYWINGERVWKEKEDYRRGDKKHTE